MLPPPSRHTRCSCGSGKRFQDCDRANATAAHERATAAAFDALLQTQAALVKLMESEARSRRATRIGEPPGVPDA